MAYPAWHRDAACRRARAARRSVHGTPTANPGRVAKRRSSTPAQRYTGIVSRRTTEDQPIAGRPCSTGPMPWLLDDSAQHTPARHGNSQRQNGSRTHRRLRIRQRLRDGFPRRSMGATRQVSADIYDQMVAAQGCSPPPAATSRSPASGQFGFSSLCRLTGPVAASRGVR